MDTERKPLSEPSLLALPMAGVTRFALRYPIAVIAAAVGLSVVAGLLTVGKLEFHTSRLDLLDPKCSHNRLWKDYIDEFGSQDDAIVVVQGSSREQVVPVLQELSAELARRDHLFNAVLHEVDCSKLRGKGLYYLDVEQLGQIEQMLARFAPVLAGDWSQLNLSNKIDELCKSLHDPSLVGLRPATLAEFDRLSLALSTTLAQPDQYRSPWPDMPELFQTLGEPNSTFFLINEGRWGLILLRLATEKERGSFAPGSEAIDTLRRLTAQAESRNPGVRIGLTGLPILENDEMRSSEETMTRATILSLVGVACLFIAGFGGMRHPMMTVVVLLLAMAWSFGYITLAIGHLNILSIAFTVILIGLGIDFGVHYVARYLQERRTIPRSADALVQTAVGVGPGVITGAVTTAIAFFVAGFTEFKGVAELGVIAGGGILLCCAGAMVVLPAMIHLSDARRPHAPLPEPLNIHAWLLPLMVRPRAVLAVSAAGTVAVAMGMAGLRYDHNLLNLQAEGLESVELEQELLNKYEQSAWFALSIADNREELVRRKAEFLKKASIDRVEDISEYLGQDHDQKRPIIERIQGRLAALPERPPEIPVDPPDELGQALGRAQVLLGGSPRALQIQRRLEDARGALRGLTQYECYLRLRQFQHGMAGDLLSRLFKLRAVADPEPPTLEDLPENLVTRLVGSSDGRQRYLMKIYSKSNIWDMAEMRRFVHDVRAVDPKATGNPLQTYEASRQMKASYENAAWYALGAIIVVLVFDFGAMRYVLLAMTPLGVGMIQMFGILGWLDIPLNPANMIVLPLILGIGVDDGVHIVHDFRRQRGPFRMSPSTAGAVLITSLTTIVGFGSLMIADHQGLQSLGRVLTIGVSCCLFTSLVMLPALLTWATRHREPEEEMTDHDGLRQIVGRHATHRHATDAYPGTSPHAVPEPSRREPVEGVRGG